MEAAPVTDPIDALQRLSGRLEHAVDVLGGRLEGDGLDGTTAAAWTKVLGELRRALAGMAQLGIAERHVELEQERAAMVTAAFLAAIGVVQLLPADRDLVVRTFLEQLGRPTVVAGEID